MDDETFDRTALRRAVVLDWTQTHAHPAIVRTVASGDVGPETAAAIEEIIASEQPIDGSLGYALEMVDVVLGAVEGSPEALAALNRLTDRDWAAHFRQKARALRAPAEDAESDVLSVLCELIFEIAENGYERGHRLPFRDQRAALATAIENKISDHLGGKRKRHPQIPDDSLDETPAPEMAVSAEDRIALAELLDRLRQDQPRQAELIELRLQGLDGKALADALGISEKAAEALHGRALKNLRQGA